MKAVKILLCAAVSVSILSAANLKADARMATVYKENVIAKEVSESVSGEGSMAHQEYKLISAEVIENADNQLLVKNNINDEKILLNINEDTLIIDGETKIPVNFSDINKGTKLLSYNSQAMTFSIPPMTNAKAVIVNADENSVSPVFFKVGTVTKNNDGSVTVTDTDNSYAVTLDKESVMTPYLTRNIVTINDVKAGDQLFVWKKVNKNNIMTLELPQKITAESCILKRTEE